MLDESTGGGRRGAARVRGEQLTRSGVRLLLTTHPLDEAQKLCTRIGIVANGRIACQGTVVQLLALVPASAVALVSCRDEGAVRHVPWR